MVGKKGRCAKVAHLGFGVASSMTTEAWHGKIMDLQGGIRARRQTRVRKVDGAGAPPESSDGGANADSLGPNSDQPPLPAHEASKAGARKA